MSRSDAGKKADHVVQETLKQGKVPVRIVMNHVTYGEYLDELVGYSDLPDQKACTAGITVVYKVTDQYHIPVVVSSEAPRGGVMCHWREPNPGEVVHVA